MAPLSIYLMEVSAQQSSNQKKYIYQANRKIPQRFRIN